MRLSSFRVVLVSGALLVSLLTIFSFQTVYAQFDPTAQSCEQLSASEQAKSPICTDANTEESPITGEDGIILKAVNLLSIVAGVIATIIIIVAGITMILSAGDSQKVSSSRDAIIYTAVGILVILLSRSIVLFIINRIG